MLSESDKTLMIGAAEIHRMSVTEENLASLDRAFLGPERAAVVEALSSSRFEHKWQLREAITARSEDWRAKEESPLTKDYNEALGEMYEYLFRHLYGDGR